MKEKLAQLYNTLSTISTKGQDTIAMANCLVFIDQMVKDEIATESKDKLNAKEEQA